MNDTPISATELKNLRFLRILVTVLTTTMILGLLTIVALLVIRFSAETSALHLPEEIVMPDGMTATAFTQGSDWYAVITADNQILIYSRETGALLQQIEVVSE